MLDQKYSKAASEVLAILKNTPKKDVKKISPKFIEFLKENSCKTYMPYFDPTKEIRELDLMIETQTLLSIIYLNYWANDEQKVFFKKKMHENELKYQEEQRKKYDPNNIFKKEKNKIYKLAKIRRR